MANVSPAQVQKFLSGMNYPVDKDSLVAYAAGRGADDSVLNTLRDLPDETYRQPTDVSRAIGEG